MSSSIVLNQYVAGGGLLIQSNVSRTGSGSISLSDTLAAAKTGTLTTRTDANTGNLTMTTGHGITTGQIVDIYWAGGVQYSVTVGTVSVDDVPIDLGIGDDLPSTSTAVTVVVQQTENIFIDGDNTSLLAIELKTTDVSIATAAHVAFYDVGDAEIVELDLVANVPRVFDITGGATNVFTGNPITYALVSQAGTSATETYTLQIIGVYDASP